MLGRVARAPPASRVGLCAPCWPAPGARGREPEDKEGSLGSGNLPPAGRGAPWEEGQPGTVVSVARSRSPATRTWAQPPRETLRPAGPHGPRRPRPRPAPRQRVAQTAARRAPLAASDPAALRRVFSLWPLSSLFSSLWGQTGGPPAAWPDTRSQGRGVGRTGSLGDCAMPQLTHQRTSLKTLTSRGARWVRRTWAGSGGGGAGPAPHGSGGPGRSSPGARPEQILRRAV